MSIDGLIESLRYEAAKDTLHLELTGRAHGEDGISGYAAPGQPYLRIIKPTWTPAVGAIIWGGAGSVIIMDGVRERVYTRWGYVKLIEAGQEAEMRAIGYPGAMEGE